MHTCTHTYMHIHTYTHTHIPAAVLLGHQLVLSCQAASVTLYRKLFPLHMPKPPTDHKVKRPPFPRVWERGKGQKVCVLLSHHGLKYLPARGPFLRSGVTGILSLPSCPFPSDGWLYPFSQSELVYITCDHKSWLPMGLIPATSLRGEAG